MLTSQLADLLTHTYLLPYLLSYSISYLPEIGRVLDLEAGDVPPDRLGLWLVSISKAVGSYTFSTENP